MTLPNRIRCFVEMAIMMLVVTAPSFAQIGAHGNLSDCDQTKAPNESANDLTSVWSRLDSHLRQASAFINSPAGKPAPLSSLARYCVAESFLEKHNYQASVEAYRDALAGDGKPAWTKVWSRLQMGKIFDVTGQRERAVAQYRLAIQTGDNTHGAMNQARELLRHPFEWPGAQ